MKKIRNHNNQSKIVKKISTIYQSYYFCNNNKNRKMNLDNHKRIYWKIVSEHFHHCCQTQYVLIRLQLYDLLPHETRFFFLLLLLLNVIRICISLSDFSFFIFRYGRWVTRKVAVATIVVIWLLAAFVSFVPISFGLHRPDQPVIYLDKHKLYPTCALDLTPTYAVVSSCISFYVPCIVMIGIYCRWVGNFLDGKNFWGLNWRDLSWSLWRRKSNV